MTKTEPNDLVRDLGLPKEKSKLLCYKLNQKHVLASETSAYCYKTRDNEIAPFLRH